MRRFRLLTARIRGAVLAFARSTRGGATLAGGVIVITGMAGVGGLMTNYAWHEAQWEELRAATRAAVAAAGPLLSGGDDDAIKARISDVLQGLMPGLAIDADDVTVSHDPVSNETRIAVAGTYEFDDIWQDIDNTAEGVEIQIGARLEFERYELAFAADVSPSMSNRLPDGTVKLDALKTAVRGVMGILAPTAQGTPGSVSVAIVPYASAVNVADTCDEDPYTGLCGDSMSKPKTRYVRMLAGVRDTMSETLRDARTAKTAGTGGHWVDTFHHYGAGTGLGPLRRQYLPDDLLNDQDWDLRRTAVDIDVSSVVPSLGTWTVDDKDFWNGCLMARWGAYWDPDARGPGWTQDNAANWPAKKAVAAWRTGASPLPASTPLHLSDAPPVASSPNTLFTAYSWPDARIAGRADGWLAHTMIEILDPGVLQGGPKVHDNDWSIADNGGDLRCPQSPVTPLTARVHEVLEAVDALETVPLYHGAGDLSGAGATYQHLGIVWALRTLSPLWQGAWGVFDPAGARRPGVPCAPGETVDCIDALQKSIILVADGLSDIGTPVTQLRDAATGTNPARPYRRAEGECLPTTATDNHYDASKAVDAASFNNYFRPPTVAADLVDGDDRLNADGLQAFVDAFIESTTNLDGRAGFYPYPPPLADTPQRRGTILGALSSASSDGASDVAPTPWELFRGFDAEVIDALVAESDFGFDGRPTLIHPRCRTSTQFGPYGRADDFVYVGDVGAGGVDPVPVGDVAPFDLDNLRFAFVDASSTAYSEVRTAMRRQLDEWLLEACRIAGARGVRINAVFIGESSNFTAIGQLLEDCVDAAGGDPIAQDVYVTPTAAELTAAFRDIVTVRRNLRFLN